MNTSRRFCLLALASITLGLGGCYTEKELVMKPISGGPGTDLELMIPWSDVALDPTISPSTVHVTFGTQVYHADYGGDPTKPGNVGEAAITDGGGTWRQSRGFFYLWQHWILFETDRVRTIVWGTTAVGRFIESAGLDPASEQLFLLCGKAVIIPKDAGVDPVTVDEGQYVIVSGEVGSGIDIAGPFTIPAPAATDLTDEEKDIVTFLGLVTADHADPCSP